MKYGLALAGGGVRGAFHMGVWKALRDMNIELLAAVGTSIGAINSALIAQNEYETALKLWRSISLEDIIKLPEGMENEKNVFNLKSMAGLAKDMYKNEGFDMSPLENIVRGIIDEDRLRGSGIDLGIAAFSLTDMKGIYRFINEIPNGQLTDFIMASASILTAKKIGDKKLSDGGVYDNMPVRMLTDKGIKNIITVDVRGVGINRGFPEAGRNIISIRSELPQTGIMEFDKGGIARSIDEGYLAALKAFGRAAGSIYAIRTDDYLSARERYSAELITGLEKAARILDISPFEAYTFDGLLTLTMGAYAAQTAKNSLLQGSVTPEAVMKEDDNAALIWLVNAIENGKESVTGKLSALGSVYDAASAILYFKN